MGLQHISRKKKREPDDTSAACIAVSPPSASLPGDVPGKNSKRIKEDSDASTKDALIGNSKRDVLLSGSGDGNESEAIRIREIIGFVPSSNGSKTGREGVVLTGTKDPKNFSFGFMDNSTSDPVSEQPCGTSTPDESLDLAGADAQGHAVDSVGNRRVLVGGMPYSLTPQQVEEFWSECGEVEAVECFTFNDTKKFRGMACVTFATEESCKASLMCNGEYADGFQLKVEPWVDSRKKTKDSAPREQTPRETPLGKKCEGYNVAFVCNLPYDLRTDDVKGIFKNCGVDYVRLHTKVESNESRGYAHVHFKNASDLDMAVALDGVKIQGRVVRIGYAKPRDESSFPTKEKQDHPHHCEGERTGIGQSSESSVGKKHPMVDSVHASNLPFKACESDIKEFLQGCDIKKVILPLKIGGGGNLGICIVDFNHSDSCDLAVRLNNSRFWGRHVAIKYAKPRDVTRLRIMASRTNATQGSQRNTREDSRELADLVNQETDLSDDPLMALL